jgi:hypothetical protein
MAFLKEEQGSTPIGAAEAWLHADMGCILTRVFNDDNMGGMRQHCMYAMCSIGIQIYDTLRTTKLNNHTRYRWHL